MRHAILDMPADQAPALGATVVPGCGIAMAGLHNCVVRAPSWWYSVDIGNIIHYVDTLHLIMLLS